MAEKKAPISYFVEQLELALDRKDGYIMGATGQNPRNWSKDSWWFTQYDRDPKAKAKALYWRENAQRVWDCNGLAEGLYKDYSGVSINTRARYNYSDWCDPKGDGMIPAGCRVPGAAVFWGDTAADITHVAYLWKPVKADDPKGDWYLVEAAGVLKGVVSSKLYSRKPNFWGWMTKYFEYSANPDVVHPIEGRWLGYRTLKFGCSGDDVKELQADLIRLGYDLGKWGVDGDFGDATDIAVRKFQKDKKLEVDGEVGPKTIEALEKALSNLEATTVNPKTVVISGGSCYIRTAPNTTGKILGVAKDGERFEYAGQSTENDWHLINYKNQNGWVSGKYSKLVK